MIVLNLKNYSASFSRCLALTDAAAKVSHESGVRIIVCPPPTHLSCSASMHKDVFAQHTDAFEQGAHTGYIIPEALKSINVKGSLVNHSEHRIGTENVGKTISLLKAQGLESIVCGENAHECAGLAKFGPDWIAVEPPELIGSGISVSKAKPEVITSTVEAVRASNPAVKVLCGAGVSTKEDVKKSLELGAKGVLLASAYVKAKDPVRFLQEFASAF